MRWLMRRLLGLLVSEPFQIEVEHMSGRDVVFRTSRPLRPGASIELILSPRFSIKGVVTFSRGSTCSCVLDRPARNKVQASTLHAAARIL